MPTSSRNLLIGLSSLAVAISAKPTFAEKFTGCPLDLKCPERKRQGLKYIQNLLQQNDLSIIDNIIDELHSDIVDLHEPYASDNTVEAINLEQRNTIAPWRDITQRVLYPASLKHQLYREAQKALVKKRSKVAAVKLKISVSNFLDKPIYPRELNIQFTGEGKDGKSYTARYLALRPDGFHVEISPAYIPTRGTIQASFWHPEKFYDLEPDACSRRDFEEYPAEKGGSAADLENRATSAYSLDAMCKEITPQGFGDVPYQVVNGALYLSIRQSRDEDSVMAQNRKEAVFRYAQSNAARKGLKGGGKVAIKAGAKGKGGVPFFAEGEASIEGSVEAFIEGNYEITETQDHSTQLAGGETQEHRFIFRKPQPVLVISVSKSNRAE